MMELWSKNLLLKSCPYKKDQVIFESSTQGTYNVEILGKGKYEVYCIGGGYFWKGSRAYSKAGGGSGGSTPEIICQSLLTAGNSGKQISWRYCYSTGRWYFRLWEIWSWCQRSFECSWR